jgi:hypothetical protein
MCYMGYAPCWTPAWSWVLLNELEVDSKNPVAAAFTGEGGGSGATVEYYVDKGAASPTIEVDIDSGGTTTAWKATAVTAGFHAHRFGAIPRGAKLTLKATDAMARLRWCEPVCC